MKPEETLLIVDDDLDLLDVLKDSFTAPQRKILCAHSALDAMRLYLAPEVIDQHHISAILSDMNMPGVSGLEFLVSTRAQNHPSNFLILTGYADKLKVFLAMKYGAYDFIEKPFQHSELSQLVDDALLKGRLRRECQDHTSNLFTELKFAKTANLRLERKIARVYQVLIQAGSANVTSDVMTHPTPEFFLTLRNCQSEESLEKELLNIFQSNALAVAKHFNERLKFSMETDEFSVEFIYFLRDIYHMCAANSKVIFSLGFESLGQWFELLESSLLYFRGFPQLIDQDSEKVIYEAIFLGEVFLKNLLDPGPSIELKMAESAQKLAQLNKKLSSSAYTLL